MHWENCSLISVAFCWVQQFNLLPKYMLCWIGIVSNTTVNYGCVIKYTFFHIATMMSWIYFQKDAAVLMKGVEEGKEECPSSNTPRKMLKTTWKDQQYVERIMQRLVKKTPFLKLAERAQKSSTRMKTIQRPSGKLISAAAHQPGKVEHPKTRGSLECPGAAAENLMRRVTELQS